ncbi:MAG: shikimate kinase [Pseudomonadota bacterium]
MAWQLNKTVVLVGMMGSGKTAVGTAVARLLGVPFLDSDEEIVRAANMSIAEIFARDGEPFFRRREAEVLMRLLTDQPAILSTGGGAFMSAENRKAISDFGIALWLRADLSLLWQRVKGKSTRPLLQTKDPYGALRELHRERVPIYELADLIVDARSDYAIEDMANQVIHTLSGRSDVLQEVRNAQR